MFNDIYAFNQTDRKPKLTRVCAGAQHNTNVQDMLTVTSKESYFAKAFVWFDALRNTQQLLLMKGRFLGWIGTKQLGSDPGHIDLKSSTLSLRFVIGIYRLYGTGIDG